MPFMVAQVIHNTGEIKVVDFSIYETKDLAKKKAKLVWDHSATTVLLEVAVIYKGE